MIRVVLACLLVFAVLVLAGVVGWDGRCARLEGARQVELCGPR